MDLQDPDFGHTRYGKVSFVDLAGSERLRDTHSTGDMLKETSQINRSLFTLGKVRLRGEHLIAREDEPACSASYIWPIFVRICGCRSSQHWQKRVMASQAHRPHTSRIGVSIRALKPCIMLDVWGL